MSPQRIMAILALNSFREWGMLIALTCGVFLFFMLLGTGLSSYTTWAQCEKTDSGANFKQGAYWALYPALGYFVIRTFEGLRVYFDRFYRGLDTSDAGKERAGWVSVGYVMMLAAVAGMFALMDSSIEAVCIPTIDEATRFRQDMLKRQAEKQKALESTPAVTA